MNALKLACIAALLMTASAEFAAAPPTKGHGLDLGAMDRKISPGDDFYDYANGTWMKNTPIPPDRSSYGVFVILDEQATERTSKLI
jgi:putative endopeptidase